VPEEILTQATRILGSGQTSLAKYCIIAADEDDPSLSTHRMPDFFRHVLERYDPERDLHFITKTTIDTLDYSGSGWNAGSKVIWACRGDKRRELGAELPTDLSLPTGFGSPRFVQAGILAMEGPRFTEETGYADMTRLKQHLDQYPWVGTGLIVICDDSQFLGETFGNFLWATFTRSNPSHDIHGVRERTEHKHWGCGGPVIIDARTKPWHAPGLVPDPEVSRRVDRLFAKGGSLHGLL